MVKRALVVALFVALTGCSVSAHPQAPARPHAASGVDALVRKSPYYSALLEYDRQIAALRALLHVAGLAGTQSAANRSAAVARAQGARAASDVGALYARAASYVASEAGFDAAAVQSAIERDYANEAAKVRAQASGAQDAYGRALDNQVGAQSAALASALDRRVTDAYAARAQQYAEREGEADAQRAAAVASRQLQLRIRYIAVARTAAEHHKIAAELDAISSTLDAAASAQRRRDGAALAAYRSALEQSAAAEYRATIDDLHRKAEANWSIRRTVTAAQLAAPPQVTLPFGSALRETMQTGKASLAALEADAPANTARTQAGFTSAANAIAQRFTSIGEADAADQANLRAEIASMERARAALYAAIAASLNTR